jgi:N-methylhydantoinase A/oxoprolinase/acetone carboxylase beta subunit
MNNENYLSINKKLRSKSGLFCIGMDIGGTNTDAVIVDCENNIIAATKSPTTNPVEVGFEKALEQILNISKISPEKISGVFIGTTHSTNALLQHKDLYNVGVVRIGGSCGESIPPCFEWPKELKELIFKGYVSVDGGYQCDGSVISQISHLEVRSAFEKLKKLEIETLAIVGVFSPLNHQQENEIKDLALEFFGPDFPVTCSYSVGGMGFINRENATLLNCALKKSLANGFHQLRKISDKLGLSSIPISLTQNNGTIIPLNEALEFPILTLSAGPTNSFVGSCKLAKQSDAVVVDVGGTSTDVGFIINGLPKRSIDSSMIAGIKLNFPMPDVLSIALGGGSIVKIHQDDDSVTVGPESCARKLYTEALSFGGNQLTLTDIGVKLGKIQLNNDVVSLDGIKRVQQIPEKFAEQILSKINILVNELVDKMSSNHKNAPVVITGGGSVFFTNLQLENRKVMIPQFADVANAYGAALAEISGSVDTVVSLIDRQKVLDELLEEAKFQAIERGADPSDLRQVVCEIIPYNYIPNNLARVKIMVAGRRNF